MPPSTGAKSIVVVVPPNSAAWLTRDAGSVSLASPSGTGIGQLQWTCGSMPPGMTTWPEASIVRPAPSAARLPGAPIATIFSPWTPISAFSAPVGRTARPPEITVSSIEVSPYSCGWSAASIRSERGCGEREAREDFVGRDVVDDEDEAAALVGIGPGIEPFRREHRVLRRLHDRRPVRAVGEARRGP